MPGKIGFEEFAKQADTQSLSPVYLAIGKEPFLLDKVMEIARNRIAEEATRDFNLDIFYGDDLTAQALASALNAMPMMAAKRVVILKRCENIIPTIQKYLADYVSNPSKDCVLILILNSDGKKAWEKKLVTKTVNIGCDTPRGRALEKWISTHASKMEITIDDDAMALMSEGREVNLLELTGELDKAVLLAGDSKRITLEVLQNVWGIDAQINIWNFFDHVAAGERLLALREFESLAEDYDKDKGAGFIISQVSRRVRLAWKERSYDEKHTSASDRTWSGRTLNQWRMASRNVKTLPKEVAEISMGLLVEMDRTRKSRSIDSVLLFKRLVHQMALKREGRKR